MTDYILGGGLAGLIWGVCHPNSTIIEKGPVGGIVSWADDDTPHPAI